MTWGWELLACRMPGCIRPARKSFYSDEEFYNSLNHMIKLACMSTLLIFFEKFNDSLPIIPNKCLYLTQSFVFIWLNISTVSFPYCTCCPHTGNRVINMRILLEWCKVLTVLTNCSYCSKAIMQIIFTSLIIVTVKKCQK